MSNCRYYHFIITPLMKIVPEVNVLVFIPHRSLMEDIETHKKQILTEQNELEDKKALIELKEVCANEGGIAYRVPSIK